MIAQDRLMEVLEYSPETGVFTWTQRRRGVKVGEECGRISKAHGYREICVDGVLSRAHRLAFIYMTGNCPKYVDHINCVKTDNRWDNLRACTHSQNMVNTELQADNTSGVKGVVWDKHRSKWRAQATIRGKKYNLGRYDDKGAAIEAYRRKMVEEHGDFFRE